jgi:tRNA nucleotidyltransferase/poly(A) polymerase
MSEIKDRLLSQLFGRLPALREAAWSRALAALRKPAWLVGGAVRDLALGSELLDIDMVLDRDSFVVGEQLAASLNARFVPLHETFGSCRLVLSDGLQLDLTDLQGASIEEDLRRRDLTINAVAIPWPQGDSVIDPTGGLDDLAARIARRTSSGVIQADPVRALRVFRFAAAFDLSIDDRTLAEAREAAPSLAAMPGERVWIELFHLLSRDQAAPWIRALDEHGVLDALLPELAACAGIEQPPLHHLDVHAHSLEAACVVDALLAHDDLAPALSSPNSRAILRLAVLLHDVGKPTAALSEDKTCHYPEHEAIGARLADRTCRRLRLSNDDRVRVTALVAAHMRPPQLADYLAIGELSARATRRFLLDLGDDWLLCLALARADLLATAGPLAPKDAAPKSRALARHLREAAENRLPKTISEPLVTGRDVLAFGVPSGPKVGRLLDAIAQAQFENPGLSHDEALTLLKKLIEANHRASVE